ncbi:alpha/beta hydrolase [Clavibacter michiganensis subsp. michiganensis]|uniref:esterase/lipase family protein n=1 Tax=Clavibacter michiganensis TaxID=28447 RepID=UPI001C6478C2|nr:alpha/beta hydrolase [Clavibacter michiganensis]MBW8026534.1 alpha/beta hydrolase [Clavibacter michiganensis subsp. michiganensis]
MTDAGPDPLPPLPLLRQALDWALDYAYVLRWQIAATLSRDDARSFEDGRDDRPTILVLPGVYERWQFMLPIIRRLHARGHGVHVVGTLGANVGRIAEMSRRARAYLEAEDLRDVVIVAHSKGGLIGKHLMAFGDPDRRIRAMVAINAPFGGSSYARLFPVRSIRDFSPRNAALVELGRSRAVNARITSLFARFDPHIPGGSALDGATDERVRASGHSRIMGDEDVLRRVEAAIDRAGSSAAPPA